MRLTPKSSNISRKVSGLVVSIVGVSKFQIWPYSSLYLLLKFTVAPKVCSLFPVQTWGQNSVQSSHSVVSNSLRPYGLQNSRLPCPSPTPGAYSNSCPSSWWHHPIISVIPLTSCLKCFPASGSFQMHQFFASDGQILELHLQHQSFHWIFRTDFL